MGKAGIRLLPSSVQCVCVWGGGRDDEGVGFLTLRDAGSSLLLLIGPAERTRILSSLVLVPLPVFQPAAAAY